MTRNANRCPEKVGWTVTWNWLGTAKHEWHRCVLPAGHGGKHKVRARNFGWWRRPFGRGSRPTGEKNGYLEW